MSLATLLVAFLPAFIRPKIEPEKSDPPPRRFEEWAAGRIERLTARVQELEEEIAYVSLERDSARRRLDAAWDTMARVAEQRIERRLVETPAQQQHAAMMQAQLYQQGNPLLQAAACQQMQNMPGQWQPGQWHDCTCVPGRSALLGALGGA